MACDNQLPLDYDFCWPILPNNEIIIFWVDQEGNPVPIDQFNSCKFQFSCSNKPDAQLTSTVTGTLEDRENPNTGITMTALVFVLDEDDKRAIVNDTGSGYKYGTVYLTSQLREFPLLNGRHKVEGFV